VPVVVARALEEEPLASAGAVFAFLISRRARRASRLTRGATEASTSVERRERHKRKLAGRKPELMARRERGSISPPRHKNRPLSLLL
jgi:hypothetical protein